MAAGGGEGGGTRLGAARAANIALRTLHLLAVALAVGAARFAPGAEDGRWWLTAAALTGAGLLALELRPGRTWFVQVRGLLALGHVGLAGLAHLGQGPGVLLAALAVGAVGSHLPKGIRKWSVVHRTIVE